MCGSYDMELDRANTSLRHNEDGTVMEESLQRVKSRVAYLQEQFTMFIVSEAVKTQT